MRPGESRSGAETGASVPGRAAAASRVGPRGPTRSLPRRTVWSTGPSYQWRSARRRSANRELPARRAPRRCAGPRRSGGPRRGPGERPPAQIRPGWAARWRGRGGGAAGSPVPSVAAERDPERIRPGDHRSGVARHAQSRRHSDRRRLRAGVARLRADRADDRRDDGSEDDRDPEVAVPRIPCRRRDLSTRPIIPRHATIATW